MSSLAPMEWNAKTPLPWDLENLITFNTTATEKLKKFGTTDWEIDGGGMDSGSFYSSEGGAGGFGGSSSDLGLASMSKSSKSASINSSSIGEVKTPKFTMEAFESIPVEINNKKEFQKIEQPQNSPTLEASVGSGEPLLGLKLGKRTYFEDVCEGSTAKTSSVPMIPIPSVATAKRPKSSCQSTQIPRCQVEGCNLDLSSSKDYHRKHRVCENHSKCPKVIVGGLERRFCQQCSRFHSLSEFDEKKRSCRRRLSDHNARRRKPQPEAVQFNAARFSSSLYDGKQQMSFVWNKVPFGHTSHCDNFTWEGAYDSKSAQIKGYIYKPAKGGGNEKQLHSPGNQLPSSVGLRNHDSNGFLLSKAKGSTTELLNQGLDETMISSNLGATQDIQRALSLLSTNSWDSCDPKHASIIQPSSANHSGMPQPVVNAVSQGFPLALSECWRNDQLSAGPQLHSLTSHNNGDNHFQEFRLFRAPQGSAFYSS